VQKQIQQVVHAVARASLLFSTIGNPQRSIDKRAVFS
jgi:hypothetical protein